MKQPVTPADQEGGSDSTDQEDRGLLVGGELCGVEPCMSN